MSGTAPAPQRIVPPLGDQPLITPTGRPTQPMVQWMQRLSAFLGPVNVTTSGGSVTNLSISEQVTNLATQVAELQAQSTADSSARAQIAALQQAILGLRAIVNQQAQQPGLAYHQPQTPPPGPSLAYHQPQTPTAGPGLAFVAPATGVVYLANGARLLDGYGAPNTLVYGSVGDAYLQCDGSTSGVIWLKASGVNTNTGWIAALGTVTEVDTGAGLTGGPITGVGTVALAAIASHDILSNITGGSAAPLANTVSDTIDAAIGSAQGDILYRSGSSWSVLAPGTAGQFLQTQGASANPAWGTVADVGRNKLDNGLFNVAQRGTGAFTTNGAYTLDRWQIGFTTDTVSVTQTTLNDTDRSQIGDEEAENGLQNVFTTAGAVSSNNVLTQKIEDVYRLSNTTVQVSFWAKAASGTPKLGVSIDQNFGSGGSATVTGTGQSVTLSTTLTRYNLSFSIASAATKTVGAGNYTALNFWYSAGTNFNTRSGSVGAHSGTDTLWGTQLEIGAVITPLEKPTFRQQFMACQRFFFSTFGNEVTPAQNAGTDTGNFAYAASLAGASSERSMTFPFPVQMRATPTITTYNVSAANAQVRDATATLDCSGTVTVATDHNVRIVTTGNAATAVGNNLQVHVTATADL